MRKMLIILISVVVTILNVNSYGELDFSKIDNSKVLNKANVEDDYFLDNSINWGYGSTVFKLIHCVELILLSEISRKRITN